jgi:Zn-finger nucleic acid-binding protein
MNCPGCGAAMKPAGNRNYYFCDHCGGYHFPQETGDGVAPTEEPAGPSCPVCDLPLVNAMIEGETVAYCGKCRGFLTFIPLFGMIVNKRRSLHSPNEQQAAPFDPTELKRGLKCPECHKRMESHPYFGGGNAVVDTCERCQLIWLDAGELAIIERYIPHRHRIEGSLRLTDQPAPAMLMNPAPFGPVDMEDLGGLIDSLM